MSKLTHWPNYRLNSVDKSRSR